MPAQKFIYILCQSQTFCARQKDDLHSVKKFFCAGTKVFEKALNAVKFLGWLKKFGPVQNILGPVKGKGISMWIISDEFELKFPELSQAELKGF